MNYYWPVFKHSVLCMPSRWRKFELNNCSPQKLLLLLLSTSVKEFSRRMHFDQSLPKTEKIRAKQLFCSEANPILFLLLRRNSRAKSTLSKEFELNNCSPWKIILSCFYFCARIIEQNLLRAKST